MGPDGGYDGFTAQTADGLNSVTAALYDGPYSFDDTGPPCYTAWITLCSSLNGQVRCVSSNGSSYASQDSYIVLSPTGYYITEPESSGDQGNGYNPDTAPTWSFIHLLILFLVIAVVAGFAIFAARRYKRKNV